MRISKRWLIRYVDSCVKKEIMLHRDGVKESIEKVKYKLKQLIEKFKALPRGKKIAIALSGVFIALGALLSANNKSKIKFALGNLKHATEVAKTRIAEDEEVIKNAKEKLNNYTNERDLADDPEDKEFYEKGIFRQNERIRKAQQRINEERDKELRNKQEEKEKILINSAKMLLKQIPAIISIIVATKL